MAAVATASAQTMVNIKGFGSDGAGVVGAQPVSLPPGTVISLVNPVRVSLTADDYLLTCAWGLPSALYDAWNYQSTVANTWDSHYYVAVQQGNTTQYTLLLDALSLRNPACPRPNCSWSTQAQAAAAFLATPAFHLHLAADTVVSFSSTDYFLPDNLGGTSLQISAVPEPSRLALWASCLLLAGLPVRREVKPSSQALSASNNSVRALSQSRRTVRSVMPRTPAISTSVMPAK